MMGRTRIPHYRTPLKLDQTNHDHTIMGTQTPPIFYPFMEKLPTPTKTPQQKQGGVAAGNRTRDLAFANQAPYH